MSIAEISLKHKKHTEHMRFDGMSARMKFLLAGCKELPVSAEHSAVIDKIMDFHFDPIDRIILAQAKSEGIKIVSHDRQFPRYGNFAIASHDLGFA